MLLHTTPVLSVIIYFPYVLANAAHEVRLPMTTPFKRRTDYADNTRLNINLLAAVTVLWFIA